MNDYKDWQFLELLGKGAFGEVWKVAREVPHAGVHQFGALKKTQHNGDPDVKTLFEREIAALANLSSPYIPTYLDSGIDSASEYWMVSGFVEGKTLWHIVREQGPLSQPDWLRLGTQLSSALTDAHSRGLSHLDIKPDNMMRSFTGDFVLVDFGLSQRQFDVNPKMAMHIFAAPEQVDGSGNLTPATDIFALAASLFFALTGESPFSRYQGIKHLEAIQNLAPALNEIDKPYREILAPMLSALPTQRPGASDVLKSFHNFGKSPKQAEWNATHIYSWDQLDQLVYETISENPIFSIQLSQPNGVSVRCEISVIEHEARLSISSERELGRAISSTGRLQLSENGFSFAADARYQLRRPALADDIPALIVQALRYGYELSLAGLTYRIEF